MLAYMALAGLLAAASAGPSLCRFYIASQHDWGRKLGFYLDFEGSKLADLPVILGVADGTRWRFIAHVPGFELNRRYTIRAVISPQTAQLFVDGRKVGEEAGGFKPAAGAALELNHRPFWAFEPGDWIAAVEKIELILRRPGRPPRRMSWDLSRYAKRPAPLHLFEPGFPVKAELQATAQDTIEITAVLKFLDGDLRRWAPFIDRYGQCRYADWPGKVKSDEELRQDIQREDAILAAMPPSPDFDPYGGYKRAGWREKPTGFFRIARRNGFYWLITPDGYPCFYLGVCSFHSPTWPTTPVTGREFLFEWLPPREDPWGWAWSKNHWGRRDGTEYVCFHTCNLIRKYGPDRWRQAAEQRCRRRLKAWGFSGGGKWHWTDNMVIVPVLWARGVKTLAGHPDVFDPQILQALRQSLQKQVAPHRDNPWILGWSFGNEVSELIKAAEIKAILGMDAKVPAKRALIEYALREMYGGDLKALCKAWHVQAASFDELLSKRPAPPDADIEKLRLFYEDRYHAAIRAAIKDADPNHLYLGTWITVTWGANDDDWRVIARHCDIIGYDHYGFEFAQPDLIRRATEIGKPILCGEFSFPPWYDGLRGYGRYPVWARDEAHAGELYQKWVRDAARNPLCVGTIWFQWRDQPLTGRGPGRGPQLTFGEHFAFGLITITDRPKWDLVRRMRSANLQAARWRLHAMSGH